ncbi:hypothetical protein [Engelhardtia mirabilis]|uniref:DUF4105 domain-containing protein n=1 Tax=Engelhardtia mirabilis TaxID=2528011 RepID=A0A518BMF7_9BACT|nr:hypothetical protein Pla133_32660 [Planctomycetes bacterium Pla133]QDV02498.1 hypothetical protein Pla86_32650 [Planctomycetes bacterium Pla86]
MLAAAMALWAPGLVLWAQAAADLEGASWQRAPEVGFIHVEGNVDAAAGGHAGLRVGPHVYHFMQTGGGTLRLSRVEWPAFRHVYAGLKNRSLHLYYLDLDAEDARRIAASAAGVWIEQELERERISQLAQDAAWWQALATGDSPPPLECAGLLAGPQAPSSAEGIALRATLRARLGEDFAAKRLDWLEAVIDQVSGAEQSLLSLRERCTEREVVLALQRAAPLADAVLVDVSPAQPLTPAERSSLELFRDQQSDRVVALWSSSRPDRGRALAVAAARHHAASRSLVEGRLLTLDGFPDSAQLVRPDADEARLAYAPLERRAREGLAAMRAGILDGGLPTELDFGRLEEAATRCREAERGAAGEPVRVCAGRLLPSRGRATSLPIHVDTERALASAASCQDQWEAADAAWRGRHGYALLSRNCATELVDLLQAAFPDGDQARLALGGSLDAGEGFAFVPWVLARQIRTEIRVREVQLVPSQRRAALDQLARAGAGRWELVREGSPLTSKLYTPRAEDGWFLFFTDDTVWNRPLCGVLNLTYGLARSVVGLFALPFDGGEEASASLHGAFYSLPELVFWNVRKGTYDSVEAMR